MQSIPPLCQCGCNKPVGMGRRGRPNRYLSGHSLQRTQPNTIMSIMNRLVIQENGCALWTASKDTRGYGHVSYDGKLQPVHVILYKHFVGPISPGLELDHFVCDNRACGNFMHVRPVTHRENVLRGSSPAAQYAHRTHCPRCEQPLNGENLRLDRHGWRHCMACERARSQRRTQARREKRSA